MQMQKCSKCDRGWDLNEAAIPVESCGADLHDKGQTFQNGVLVSALQLSNHNNPHSKALIGECIRKTEIVWLMASPPNRNVVPILRTGFVPHSL